MGPHLPRIRLGLVSRLEGSNVPCSASGHLFFSEFLCLPPRPCPRRVCRSATELCNNASARHGRLSLTTPNTLTFPTSARDRVAKKCNRRRPSPHRPRC